MSLVSQSQRRVFFEEERFPMKRESVVRNSPRLADAEKIRASACVSQTWKDANTGLLLAGAAMNEQSIITLALLNTFALREANHKDRKSTTI